MSLEKIIDRIKQDTQTQFDEIKSKALVNADEIIQKAKESSDSYKEQALINAQKSAQQHKQRLISTAVLEFRKDMLKEKQDAIDSAFQESVNNLVNMKDDEYRKVIKKMLLASVQTGEEEIIISSRDRSKITEIFIKDINKELAKTGKKGNLRLSKNHYDILGGFILKSGNIELNNSFESLFNSFREDLEAEVSKILFA